MENLQMSASMVDKDLPFMIDKVPFQGPYASEHPFLNEPGILATLVMTDRGFVPTNIYQTADVKASARLEFENRCSGAESILCNAASLMIAAHYNGALDHTRRVQTVHDLWSHLHSTHAQDPQMRSQSPEEGILAR